MADAHERMRDSGAGPNRAGSFDGLIAREAGRVALAFATFRDRALGRLSGDYPCDPRPAARRQYHHEPGDPVLAQADPAPSQHLGFSPFYYYPFLFSHAFPSVRVQVLRTLALANRILLEGLLLLDTHIDENRPWSPRDLYLADHSFHRAAGLLSSLFPFGHAFWHQTEQWYLQYARAVLAEQVHHRYRLEPYTEEAFFEIATGKVALIKTNLLALGLLSGRTEHLSRLMASQDRFLAGFQCYDDLKDWREDLRRWNFTYLLSRTFEEGGFSARVLSAELPPEDDVGRVLYYRGIADAQLALAEGYFQEALRSADGLQVPFWCAVVKGFLGHCRTMREDLAEIRRRGVQAARRRTRDDREASPQRDVAASLARALSYLALATGPDHGFRIARSRYPYLSPSTDLGPSRFVTTLVLVSLGPLAPLDQRLSARLEMASTWLLGRQGPAQPGNQSIPAELEACAAPQGWSRTELAEFDRSVDPAMQPHPLFWALLLCKASKDQVTMPALEAHVCRSVQHGSYSGWTRPAAPDNSTKAHASGGCRPLLPLLLFCHAIGPYLPRQPLHAYLLGRNRTDREWKSPTELAQTLLCLLGTGYQGPEPARAVERLLEAQEPDGSWPPNAFYEHDGWCYGSRELTTAWCAAALFLSALPHRIWPTRDPRDPATVEPATPTRIILHAGLHDKLCDHSHDWLERLRPLVPRPWPRQIYIGHWPSIPAHFVSPGQAGPIVLGVNILPGTAPYCRSTAGRPLRVELAMGLITAVRCMLAGPLKDRIERLYMAGLGLWTSGRIWPDLPPWERLGMTRLDWLWCRRHEALLWDQLKRFLLCPDRRSDRSKWLLPDHRPSSDSALPRGSALYLAGSLFQGMTKDGEMTVRIRDGLRAERPDIVRAFQKKVGSIG